MSPPAALSAEVIAYRSGIDGSEQRAALCGPLAPPPGVALPLLVELVPGSINALEKTLEAGQLHLGLVGEPAVWLRPGARGPGTVFQDSSAARPGHRRPRASNPGARAMESCAIPRRPRQKCDAWHTPCSWPASGGVSQPQLSARRS